jgi:hypothetical protein
MKKAIRYTIVFFLSVEILTTLALSQTGEALLLPGVYPGDWFVYGRPDGSSWASMNPSSAPPLSQWEKFMNVSTVSFNITSNTNLGAPLTQIMFNETWRYRNGTTVVVPKGTVDIENGGGIGATFFIASNLKEGDRVYPAGGANFTYTINKTTTNPNWPGREVCVLNFTRSVTGNYTIAAQATVVWWDRQTGVLLAAYEAAQAFNASSNLEVHGSALYELIANSIGIPMDYSRPVDMTPVYVAIAIGAVAILGYAITRTVRHKPTKEHKRLERKR